MPAQRDVRVRPITAEDVGRVAAYLHRQLNPRLSAVQWASAIVPPWAGSGPNHGFMLLRGDEVVGANLAFYSRRTVEGRELAFCNLAALCVDEEARLHTVRLIRAVLRQRGYEFTDLSPSGNVVAIDERLGFRRLDPTTVLAPNLPLPRRGVRVVDRLDDIATHLTGDDLRIFTDHRRARAARHLLLVTAQEHCYVVYRRDRRKGLPLFASILHVSDPAVFAAAFGSVAAHLLRRGMPLTLAERRVVELEAPLSRTLPHPRQKMFLSAALDERDIDNLYSELVCVSW